MFWVAFIAGTAVAGDVPGQFQTRKMDSYKVNLVELSNTSEPRLDWRNPVYDIQFETPTSDWVEKIDLYIKIHAEGSVKSAEPIYVQFNDAEPVAIHSKGNSFEARLNLDISKVKAHRNNISIRYGNSSTCLTPQDGAFSINMEDSLLIVKASTPSRPYYLRDITEILASPMTTPKTVAINAVGANRLKYEALTAQGIALNTPKIPQFNLGSSLGDMQIHVGTRADLTYLLKGKQLATTSGPVIGVINNAPLQLVITADNATELEELLGNFSTRLIPSARRTYAFNGEFVWQSPFRLENAPVSGSTYLHEMGNLRFDRGLGNSRQLLEFDVDNPLSAHGMLKINVDRSKDITATSNVAVNLNGYHLGDIFLNRTKNSVQFDIPKGILIGSGNRLSLSPDLSPTDTKIACGPQVIAPNVFVGSDSYISISSDKTGFTGDLTRFAASGFPFSEDAGSNTAVVFSTRSVGERAAALRVYAQLAKVYGSGWTNADVYSLADMPSDLTENILVIGPNFDAQAPKSLANASYGRLSEPRRIQTAQLDDAAISLMSVRTGAPIKGGIAAIFENPNNAETLKAYVTISRGQNFAQAMNQILETEKWNKLQGSMARWNGSTVEMTKTAFEIETVTPGTPKSMNRLDAPTFSWPSLGDMSAYRVDMRPVFQRIIAAAGTTKTLMSNILSDIGAWLGGLFQGESTLPVLPETEPQLTIEPDLLPEQKPQPAPIYKPAPTVVTVADPAPVSTIKVMEIQRAPQYDPGASLRGFSSPTATPSDIGPVQYKPLSSLSGNVKTAYEETSGWMSGFINKFMGVAGTTDRKANLVIFAAAIMLLLLLLALARPHREDYH